MASVNKVILVGNLGADPEVRYTGTGKAVCNLRVATTDSWGGDDGARNERTEWHSVVVWGKTAENCGQYLAKGRSVYVEGHIQSREYEGREGKRTAFEIVADRVQFLGGREEGGRDRGGTTERKDNRHAPAQTPAAPEEDDGLPF